MINNKALVCSYVAKIFADGTQYHESIKESDDIGYIYDAVEELLNTKLSKQEKEGLPFDVQIIRLTERTKDDDDAQLIIAAYLLDGRTTALNIGALILIINTMAQNRHHARTTKK